MRRALLTLGLSSLAVAWLGPLPELASVSFTAHMSLHMTVVAVAAPLIAFGLAGTRADLAIQRPNLFPPVLASAADLLVVWAWHAPALHHAARQSFSGLVAEQTTFLLAALWLWIAAVGGAADRLPARKGPGVFALLFTSMHMTLLGALLALASRPLYGHHGAPGDPLALVDQHWGGAIMLLGGSLAYLAGAMVLTGSLLGAGVERRSATVSS